MFVWIILSISCLDLAKYGEGLNCFSNVEYVSRKKEDCDLYLSKMHPKTTWKCEKRKLDFYSDR